MNTSIASILKADPYFAKYLRNLNLLKNQEEQTHLLREMAKRDLYFRVRLSNTNVQGG
jgi:hypothetical protein